MTSTPALYPAVVYDTPPTEFSNDVDDVCTAIHAACKGFGTDEDGLIDALAGQSGETRYLINERYEGMFGKDLRKVMQSECGRGKLGLALQYLALPPDEAEAMMLNKALSGVGTKERLIWPIICGRDNKEIAQLKEQYFKIYDKDLGVQLSGELGGDFERLIFHCLQGYEDNFDDDYHTMERAEADAKIFNAAGEGHFGTDEKSLFVIIAKSPPAYLEMVNEIYVDKYERTLISALESELGGDVEKGAMHAVGMKIKPGATVAKLIKSTCAGFGTDELGLACAIIRYQSLLKDANEAHQELYSSSIQDRIKDEARGDYEKLLCAIVDLACA